MKKLLLLSLTILCFLLSTLSTVGCLVNEYSAIDYVKNVTSLTTFTVTEQEHTTIELAYIQAIEPINNTQAKISDFLESGAEVYLDIVNQRTENDTLILTSIVYIEYNSTYYENVNKALVSGSNYFFFPDNGSMNILPYDWNTLVYREFLGNNTSRLDYSDFENMRIPLMNTYNAQTLTHAGYLITVVLASITLFISIVKEDQVKVTFKKKYGQFIFLLAFAILISLCLHLIFRLFYWSWMTSSIPGVLPAQAMNQNSASLMAGMQQHLANSYSQSIAPLDISCFYYYLNPLFSALLVAPFSFFVAYNIIIFLRGENIFYAFKFLYLKPPKGQKIIPFLSWFRKNVLQHLIKFTYKTYLDLTLILFLTLITWGLIVFSSLCLPSHYVNMMVILALEYTVIVLLIEEIYYFKKRKKNLTFWQGGKDDQNKILNNNSSTESNQKKIP